MFFNILKLVRGLIQVSVSEKYVREFEISLNKINLVRGKVISITFILMELIMIISSLILKKGDMLKPPYMYYGVMYVILIIAMIIYLIIYLNLEKNIPQNGTSIKITGIIFSITLVSWCVGISLIDQLSYGQIIVYVVAIMSVAVVPIFKPTELFIIYLISQALFIILLPYFQKSNEIVFGNIVNSTFFLISSWVISGIRYKNYIEEFNNKKIIEEKTYELNRVNKELEEANRKLEKLSKTDSLTGILNRLVFDKTMKAEWERCKESLQPLSLIMIDIDLFKLFNDNYGHQAGDDCIRQVAGALVASAKPLSDIVARYGGEEFAIILPHINKEKALELAEQLRKNVEGLAIPHAYSFISKYVTISLGVHTLIPSDESSIEKLIRTADNALYQAKEKRNNVVYY